MKIIDRQAYMPVMKCSFRVKRFKLRIAYKLIKTLNLTKVIYLSLACQRRVNQGGGSHSFKTSSIVLKFETLSARQSQPFCEKGTESGGSLI